MTYDKPSIKKIAEAEAKDYEQIYPRETRCNRNNVLCNIDIGLVVVVLVIAAVTIGMSFIEQ